MAIVKPTEWSDWSAELPILAVPSVKGYEMYEAIRERVEDLFPDPESPDIPAALLPMLADFNPNSDYKIIEANMHNAVTELIPLFANWVSGGMWTENGLLAELGEDGRQAPNPYFLSAKWLKQMFRIVNYLRKTANIISISWIDEAEPVYTSGTIYDEHKAVFEEAIGFNTAVIQPGGSSSGDVFGASGAPSNVLYYSCDRDPCNSMTPFVSALNALKAQYSAARYTIGLFVDSSGSMSLGTIQPAYDNFVAYINENYPDSSLVERTAGNESWLLWTKDYIEQLSFDFQYNE